jgi:hypothetical protein
MNMNMDAYYQNRKKTQAEQKAWDSFEAAYDLASEHFCKPIRKIEMNRATRDSIFGGPCDTIFDSEVVMNDALLDKNVVFESESEPTENDFDFFDYID